MNPQRKSSKLLLMLGVVMLFGISSILPGIKHAQGVARLHNAQPSRVADKRAERVQGLNAEDRQIESEDTEAKELRTDHPDEAARFRRLQLQDEKGVIPVDGLEKAKQQVRSMRVDGKGNAKLSAGVKPESWSWMGPGNIGGRIRSIVISPTTTTTMWVGSVSGGIWRTDNGGDSWFPVNDFLANLAVSTMVINPAMPSDMYAGTGEVTGSQTTQGAGVFKSVNSGLTWDQLPSTNPSAPLPNGCGGSPNCPWLYVNRLAISLNGATILAATWNGIQRSTDAGNTWNPTVNGGGAWRDIDFHPTDNQRAIAGGNGGAVFSTNGGLNWTTANFNPAIAGRVEMAYAPSSPNIIYASVNNNNGEVYRSTDGQSTNGVQNYARVDTTNYNFFLGAGNQGNYDNIIWVNPQDPTFVIVGGIDLWRSNNSGGTFARISQWQDAPGSSAHADHHMIVAHPGFNNTTNRIAYFGNDGGIYRADNVQTVAQTSGWVNRNNNLGITQFYGAAGNFIIDTFGNPSPVIIGGTQDNGTLVYSGATNWAIGRGGDGGYCAADPTDTTYYGEYVYLTIHRSTNGSGFGDIYFGITDANSASTANFIAPFILDPNDSNTMLAGGLSLWRSTDVKSFIPAPTWASVKAPTGNTIATNGISAIAVSPSASANIAVGHNNGDVFLTFDGTEAMPNWAKIDTANLPNRFVTRLTIDDNRIPIWIYATFGGFSADNVNRTTNFGATWTDVTGTGSTGLPDVPVRSLVFHPRDANLLYVGTEIGVFTSDDAGATWEVPQNGPANVSVDDLFWMGEDLIAVTHGRGLYRASGGIFVDCNYVGTELGTFNQPFKTITAALNAAITYRTIWLKPCLYNEPPMINKRVQLRSLGGTALVRNP